MSLNLNPAPEGSWHWACRPWCPSPCALVSASRRCCQDAGGGEPRRAGSRSRAQRRWSLKRQRGACTRRRRPVLVARSESAVQRTRAGAVEHRRVMARGGMCVDVWVCRSSSGPPLVWPRRKNSKMTRALPTRDSSSSAEIVGIGRHRVRGHGCWIAGWVHDRRP